MIYKRDKNVRYDIAHLIAAAAPRPDALAVVPSAKQLLIGPEVNQVHQSLTTRRAHEAVGMPQGAVVTRALGVNSRTLLAKVTLATAAALEEREETSSDQDLLQTYPPPPPHERPSGRTYSALALSSWVPLVEPAAVDGELLSGLSLGSFAAL